jgi:uncharacterized protein
MTQSALPDTVLIERVSNYVMQFMSRYDGSHDYQHILRVLGLARHIAASSASSYDTLVVTLSALLHDVGDKKYLEPGQDSTTMVQTVLLGFGVEETLAKRVQTIASAVSYSSEIKDPTRVRNLIREYPELAVVQDADRLDAIGAVGIGRAFTYGGAAGTKAAGQISNKARGTVERQDAGSRPTKGRGMDETIEHFTDKLERLEGMMKTDAGKQMARERTQRLKLFRQWWAEEVDMAHHAPTMV